MTVSSSGVVNPPGDAEAWAWIPIQPWLFYAGSWVTDMRSSDPLVVVVKITLSDMIDEVTAVVDSRTLPDQWNAAT